MSKEIAYVFVSNYAGIFCGKYRIIKVLPSYCLSMLVWNTLSCASYNFLLHIKIFKYIFVLFTKEYPFPMGEKVKALGLPYICLWDV